MCMGGPDAPAPQPKLPEAPTPPGESTTGAGNEQQRRRRAASAGGTILTGPRGADQESANVAQKTLLGA